MSVYVAHWNLYAESGCPNMVIDVRTESNTRGEIYFDNCLLTCQKVTFLCKFRLYGGALNFYNATLYQVVAQHAIISISDQITVTNTANAIALEFINCVGRVIGTITASELAGASYDNALAAFNGGTFYITATLPNNSLTNKYNYGFTLTNGAMLRIPEATISNTKNNNRSGIQFSDTRCSIITNYGIQNNTNVRYRNNNLQYWNGSAWTNVP